MSASQTETQAEALPRLYSAAEAAAILSIHPVLMRFLVDTRNVSRQQLGHRKVVTMAAIQEIDSYLKKVDPSGRHRRKPSRKNGPRRNRIIQKEVAATST